MRHYVLVIICFFLLGLTSGKKIIPNGFAKTWTDPENIETSAISVDQANRLFQKFAKTKRIPFRYPIDGCYARATEMARIAEQENIHMGKIFVEGNLQVKTESAMYPTVQWGWHVAPVAYVRSRHGTLTLMVFDPSLFDRPVSVEEWKDKMMHETPDFKPAIQKEYYSSRFQMFRNLRERYKGSWELPDLELVIDTFNRYRPLQDLPPESDSRQSHQIQNLPPPPRQPRNVQ